jgi:glycosyltransferase involved in cell wall biosynthesis
VTSTTTTQSHPRSGDAAPGTVLLAHPSADLYGSDRVLIDVVVGLVAAGWRTVVTLPAPGPLETPLREAGAEVRRCPVPVLRKAALRPAGFARLLLAALVSALPTLRLLRSVRPDVLYVSTLTIPSWLLVGRLARRRVLCHVHEAESGVPPWIRRALAAPLLAADEVVANSSFSREVLLGALPSLARRTEVEVNPVRPTSTVSPPRAALDPPVRLLFVGRLSPRKGPDVAVEALHRLAGRLDTHLDLVGSVFPGYEWFEDRLRSRVEELGLSGRVTFHGFRPDVGPAFAGCDIALVPSVADEPFGNTAVEALLAARPVVASASGGLTEAVAGAAAARTVPAGDARALADAVAGIAADWPTVRTSALADAELLAARHDPDDFGARLADRIAALAASAQRELR